MNPWWLLLIPVGPMLWGAGFCALIWLFSWHDERTNGPKASVEGGSYLHWFIFWSTYPPLIIVTWFGGFALCAVPWIGAFAT